MTPLDLDIEVPRNGHYYQMWQMLDYSGEPIDLTDHTLTMAARSAAGIGSIIASAILTIDEAASGTFHVKWTGTDFASVNGKSEIVRLAYDFRAASGGVSKIITRGHIVLYPGVTA